MTPKPMYADPRTAAFRATLDRLPDEIALAIGLHLYDENTLAAGWTCVCGWAIREAIARETARAAEDVRPTEWGTGWNECAKRFGGDASEWDDVFCGVVTDEHAPLIEEALFDRVMAASSTKKRRSA